MRLIGSGMMRRAVISGRGTFNEVALSTMTFWATCGQRVQGKEASGEPNERKRLQRVHCKTMGFWEVTRAVSTAPTLESDI